MIDAVTKTDVREARIALAKVQEAEELARIVTATGLDCEDDNNRCKQMKGFLTQFLEMFGQKFPTH